MSLASASPESSASSWRRSPSAFSAFSAATPSASVASSPSVSPSSTSVVASSSSRSILASDAEPVLERRALAHELLGGFGVVPETGVFGFGVEFG